MTTRDLLARGSTIAVTNLDPSTLARTENLYRSSALGLVADVTDRLSHGKRLSDNALDRYGRMDVAIANAGLLAHAVMMRTTRRAPSPSRIHE